jgi:hypothetical protein
MDNQTTISGDGEGQWECPWCGGEARNKVSKILPDARACDCGAVGMAAPQVDSDEIIDAAIDYFHVTTRPESRGFDAELWKDIQQSGIEIREGMLTRDPDKSGIWATIRHLWFRRQKTKEGAA